MVLLGRGLFTSLRIWRLGVTCLGAAFIHWLVSDIGPCIEHPFIELSTSEGWSRVFACYLSAIPWSMRFLLGTFSYSVLLFGGFELLKAYVPLLHKQKA